MQVLICDVEKYKFSSCDLGRHEGMLAGHCSLLHRGCSVVSCDRPIVPIEAHRQEQLFTGHAVLDDHCALGRL